MASLLPLVQSSDFGTRQRIQSGDTLVVNANGLDTDGSALNLAGGSGNSIVIAAGDSLSGAAGAGAVDWSSMTGSWQSPTGTFTSSASQNDFTNNIDASGGLDIDADSTALTIGAGADLSISHDGTNTTATSATGDFILDNTLATGSTIMRLGTDTSATDFQVQNNSASALFSLDASGQADFSGNVDANSGLDVSGGALTVDNQAITQTTGGQVTFAGNVDANGGLDVAGSLTMTGTSIDLDPTGSVTLDMDASQTINIAAANGVDNAFRITDGTSDLLAFDTSGEVIDFGNATDNPTYNFLGTGAADFGGNVTVSGDLIVQGTTTTVDSETVNIEDNHLFLNDGYTTDAAQTGGLVVNYDPSTVTSNVATGGFTAGVASTSDATVKVDSTTGFAAGDFILVDGANLAANDGLWEVHAVVDATTLAIAGVGAGGSDERVAPNDWTQTNFTTDSTVAGSVTKIAISILRAGTDGAWETASGDTTTGLTFSDLSTASAVTLQDAYDNDADGGNVTVTMNSTDGKIIWAGDQDMQWTTSGTLDIDSAVNVSAAYTQSGGSMLFTDGTALFFGTDNDTQINHSGTNFQFVNAVGDCLFNNNAATGTTSFQLGTDTSATDFKVINDTGSDLFVVDGSGQADLTGNLDASGGVDIDADSTALTIGAGADLSISHDGTNTTATSATGDFILDNTLATGSTIMRLGTDTTATDFQIQNNSATSIFTMRADGSMIVNGDTGTNGQVLTTDGSGIPTWEDAPGVTEVETSLWKGAIAVGSPVSITTTDLTLSAADATSGSGDTSVIGISTDATVDAGKVVHAGLASPQFIAGLSVTSGERIYVAKDSTGRVTTDVSGFSAGDTIQPMGYVRDNTGLSATTVADETCECIILIGEPVVL